VRGLGPFGQAVGFGNAHHEAQVNKIKVHGHGGIIPPGPAHEKSRCPGRERLFRIKFNSNKRL
jgi:hypothetical protein